MAYLDGRRAGHVCFRSQVQRFLSILYVYIHINMNICMYIWLLKRVVEGYGNCKDLLYGPRGHVDI